MGYFKTRGLLGEDFEELINMTNDKYLEDDLAVIQKIPTPIKPVEMEPGSKRISLAYFDKKSTVDYVGNIQGIPVCFDAKQTSNKSLPIDNIHEHQIEFMEKFRQQDGLSFLIVNFTAVDKSYVLDYSTMRYYWDQAMGDGRKSIPLSAFSEELEVKREGRYLVHYLPAIEKLIKIESESKEDQ